jgi:hypothetical protein
MSQETAPPAKRAKPLVKEFEVTISNPHSFKALCEVVSNVLINVHFQLVKEESFEGVRVDTVDPTMACMVKAKFACTVWLDTKTPSFCVRMKTLLMLFRHISAHHVLTLVKYADSPDLVLKVYHRFEASTSMEFVINTLEQEYTRPRMMDIASQYTVEIALTQCKTIFKMSKDIKASNTQFEIYENDAEETFFRIVAEGEEATVRYSFQSSTKSQESATGQKIYALQQRSHAEVGQMTRRYRENFSTEFLNLFLKSMEKQALHLTLVPDGPLIIRYHLGADHSNVHFVLAARD